MDELNNPLLQYRAQLLAYLLHLVRNPHDAEELYQELATVVLKNPQLLERAGDVFAYLRGVARHLAAGQYNLRTRDNQALRQWTEWAWEADASADAADPNRQIQIEALRKCRESLPDRTQTVLTFHYDQGLELREIAERVGSQTGAIKALLFRARRTLADCIRLRLAQEGSA
jgi:RNA polymerase sigma-70 factor, ECF subfamily